MVSLKIGDQYRIVWPLLGLQIATYLTRYPVASVLSLKVLVLPWHCSSSMMGIVIVAYFRSNRPKLHHGWFNLFFPSFCSSSSRLKVSVDYEWLDGYSQIQRMLMAQTGIIEANIMYKYCFTRAQSCLSIWINYILKNQQSPFKHHFCHEPYLHRGWNDFL